MEDKRHEKAENHKSPFKKRALDFSLNETAPGVGYDLDGQKNVTTKESTKLTDLSYGAHIIAIYAKDVADNIRNSTFQHIRTFTSNVDSNNISCDSRWRRSTSIPPDKNQESKNLAETVIKYKAAVIFVTYTMFWRNSRSCH